MKFGPLVFYLFSPLVINSVLQFSIYLVLWIWSIGPEIVDNRDIRVQALTNLSRQLTTWSSKVNKGFFIIYLIARVKYAQELDFVKKLEFFMCEVI